MNCNILESLMLLLLLACVVVARLLWGCCRRQPRTEMPIYCLLPAYCPRDNRELKSRRAAEKSQQIQQQYDNNNNTSCKLMCRGGTKNTNQMQTHAAPKFTVTTTTNTKVESTQSWCLGDFYFYPKPPSCSCARFSSVDRHRLSNGRNEETTTTTTQATSTTIVQWIYA